MMTSYLFSFGRGELPHLDVVLALDVQHVPVLDVVPALAGQRQHHADQLVVVGLQALDPPHVELGDLAVSRPGEPGDRRQRQPDQLGPVQLGVVNRDGLHAELLRSFPRGHPSGRAHRLGHPAGVALANPPGQRVRRARLDVGREAVGRLHLGGLVERNVEDLLARQRLGDLAGGGGLARSCPGLGHEGLAAHGGVDASLLLLGGGVFAHKDTLAPHDTPEQDLP